MKKLVAWICIIAMSIQIGLPVHAEDYKDESQAIDKENSAERTTYDEWINPLYEDTVLEENPVSYASTLSDEEVSYLTDESQVIAQIRESMRLRKSEFKIYYQRNMKDKEDSGDWFKAWVSEKFYYWIEQASKETNRCDEGDYITFHMGKVGMKTSASADSEKNYHFTFTFECSFYTTADQEEIVKSKVNDIFKQIGMSDQLSDYEKTKRIYDYICENVTYDTANLENDDYKLKYSAYAAVVNNSAVCQGYANLFYYMAKQAGLDTRIVAGVATSGGTTEKHGWNIVKLGGVYYLLDSTWDAGRKTYGYFLKGSVSYKDHFLSDKYTDETFTAQYPISATDHVMSTAKTVTAESLGVNVRGILSDNNVLLITGTGRVDAINSEWLNRDNLQIIIEDTITGIGKDVFKNTDHIASITISKKGSELGILPVSDTSVSAKESETLTFNHSLISNVEVVSGNGSVNVEKDEDGVWKVYCKNKGKAVLRISYLKKSNLESEQLTLQIAHAHEWNDFYTLDLPSSVESAGCRSIHCKLCDAVKENSTIVIPRIESVSLSATQFVCDGKVKKPAVKVTDETGAVLSEGKDYVVSGTTGAKGVGTYTLTVEFLNRYSGSKKLSYSLVLKKMSAPSISKVAVTKIKISWTNVYGASEVQISKSTSKTGTAVCGSFTGTDIQFKPTQNKNYYYKVRAYKNVNGTVVYGPWSDAVLYNLRYVQAASNVKADLSTYNAVSVTWGKSVGANQYAVYYKKAGAKSYTFLGSTTGTSFKKSGLSSGVQYTFKVIPRYVSNGKILLTGSSMSSSVYTLKQLGAPTVTKYSSTKANVTWAKINGASGYQISQSNVKTATNIRATVTASQSSSKLLTTTKNKKYYYKIRAYKVVGNTKVYGPWSSVRFY